MSTFYLIDPYQAKPTIRRSSSMNEDEAYNAVVSGKDVWTEYGSDAERLARRFPNYYRDVIHYDLKGRPGIKFTLEHFHDSRSNNHAHIFFGPAVNDHDKNNILLIK